MSTAFDEMDESIAILENHRATMNELQGNLQRLRELVEEQILLEKPPRQPRVDPPQIAHHR